MPIDSRPVDLVDLAARVVERFKASADPRDIALTAPRPVEIRGDATHLDRALSNLVDNAIRHGAGDIEVAVSAAPGTAAITVSDEGDGFPMDISSRSGDSGLGLRIVREIARAHGGSVDVDRIGDRTRVRLVLASPQDH